MTSQTLTLVAMHQGLWNVLAWVYGKWGKLSPQASTFPLGKMELMVESMLLESQWDCKRQCKNTECKPDINYYYCTINFFQIVGLLCVYVCMVLGFEPKPCIC